MNIHKIKNMVMGTKEASDRWSLTQDHIKKLCRQGKCQAFQIGMTWILLKDQPNPARKNNEESGAKSI